MKKFIVLILTFVLVLQAGVVSFAQTEKTGDVDGDGTIAAQDARLALRLSVSLDKAAWKVRRYADADGDGEVKAADARLILRAAVGLDGPEKLADVNLTKPSFSFYPDLEHGTELRVAEQSSLFAGNVVIRKGDNYTWSSSNPDSVTVDSNGTITGLTRGFSCVILTVEDEKFYYFVSVQNEIQQKLDALREKYPDGYYWNNLTPSERYPDVTETPCPGHLSGDYSTCIGQCWGFANLISDEVFGKNAPKQTGVTAETMKIGDHIRTSHHSVIITDLIQPGEVYGYNFWSGENIVADSTIVIVVHCNWGYTCNIMWDYDYTDYIYSYDSIVPQGSYTRY